MADTNDDGYTTIDQLDPAGTLNGSEAIHGIQNEVDVKITPQQIKDFLGSSVAVVDATCNTAAATANKVVTIAGYTLNPKDILAITFTYGNSYGDSTAVSKTFPNLVVNGTTLKVCDSRGNSAGKGCWNAGDRIEFRVNTAKTEVYIMSHDVRQSSDGVTITSDGSSYYNKQTVDNALYYQVGDVLSLACPTAGLITGDGKSISFVVPVGKKFDKISTLNFISISNFSLRQNGKYVGGTSGTSSSFNWDLVQSITLGKRDGYIAVDILYKSTAVNSVNNDTIAIYINFKVTCA